MAVLPPASDIIDPGAALDNEPSRSGEGHVFNGPSASQPEQLLANHPSHHKSLMDNNNHLALVCGCPVLVRAPLHY